MMFSTEIKTVTARRIHRCTSCGELINVGEQYKKWASVDDTWFTSKMHPECLQSHLDDADCGRFEYMPYSNERPKP